MKIQAINDFDIISNVYGLLVMALDFDDFFLAMVKKVAF